MSDGSEVSVRPLEEADWEECVDFGVEAFAAIPPSVKTLEEVSAACTPCPLQPGPSLLEAVKQPKHTHAVTTTQVLGGLPRELNKGWKELKADHFLGDFRQPGGHLVAVSRPIHPTPPCCAALQLAAHVRAASYRLRD